MQTKDRKSQLLQSPSLNGIDFVEIANDAQTALRIHFFNAVPLKGTISKPTISGGETIRNVSINPINEQTDWAMDGNHQVLMLSVVAPGDFSNYTFSITSPKLDGFFTSVSFSFKDRCPSDLDCRSTSPDCPPAETDVPPIDYLAKDFLSFRQALLDFSSLRYPEWQERSEADFGVMFAEALSALADDLSYTQDRIAAEAALDTATQRRSLVRLARMVDYEPRRATAAQVMLQFDVAAGVNSVAHGVAVNAPGPDGTPIVFETGNGLLEVLIDPATGKRLAAPPTSIVSSLWNSGSIQPYWLDDTGKCLQAGATEMFVLGRGYNFQTGQYLLIDTQGATSADPPIRQIVQLIAASGSDLPAVELCDALFTRAPDSSGPPFLTCPLSPPQALQPTAYTRIRWQDADALLVDHDLSVTTVSGNLVPASHGQTRSAEIFAITAPPPGNLNTPLAIVRTGPQQLPTESEGAPPVLQYLYTLGAAPLAWMTPAPASADLDPLPEILVEQMTSAGPLQWNWFRRLLDAEQFASVFTLDEASYRPILTNSDGSTQYEYHGDDGDTIRFGDGTFGDIPQDGTLFRVTYRVGGGADGNVAAGAISRIDPAILAMGQLQAVRNPLAATGGADAEAAERVRRLAPQKFLAIQNRAVIPADYQAAAETLPWVQRAGSVFRWTGSWLTVFTTPDPLGSEEVSLVEQTELIDLLNRYRMAGYESYVPPAQYVSLDIQVQVCADSDAFRGDVETAILARLNPSSVVNGVEGFFNPDNFTFGGPLERSRLEAAVQSAPGVAGVVCVHYRVRGRTQGLAEMPDVVTVGADQIIRCDNDPSAPEHGSIQINIAGGK